VEAGDVQALTAALDRVVLEMSEHERRRLELRGRDHALAFDRVRVFDDLFRAQMQPLGRSATVTTLRLHGEQAADAR
jgi:glycogen synthase